jgi:hypothetical protein
VGTAAQRQTGELPHQVDQQTDNHEVGQEVLAWPAVWLAKARGTALPYDVVVGFQRCIQRLAARVALGLEVEQRLTCLGEHAAVMLTLIQTLIRRPGSLVI